VPTTTSPIARPSPGYAPATPKLTTPRTPPLASRAAVAAAAPDLPTPQTSTSAPSACGRSASVATTTRMPVESNGRRSYRCAAAGSGPSTPVALEAIGKARATVGKAYDKAAPTQVDVR
jgi:hypothetical protein